MKQFSNARVLLLSILVLFCFLSLTALMIDYHEKDLLRKDIYNNIKGDLGLMADASLEALLKSDYVGVRNFVKQWGKKRKEYRELRFVAPNGFVIAEYRSPDKAVGETYSLTKEVMVEQTKLATIYLRGDYHEAKIIAESLRNRLILAGFIITTLLASSLWFIFRKLAIAPLEDVVSEQSCALSDANQQFEQLAEHSPT